MYFSKSCQVTEKMTTPITEGICVLHILLGSRLQRSVLLQRPASCREKKHCYYQKTGCRALYISKGCQVTEN
jgi:hypothetical protein